MAASWFYILTLVVLIIIAILIVFDIVFYNKSRLGQPVAPNWALTMLILWAIFWVVVVFIIFFALWLLFSKHFPYVHTSKTVSVSYSGDEPVVTGSVNGSGKVRMVEGVPCIPVNEAAAYVASKKKTVTYDF